MENGCVQVADVHFNQQFLLVFPSVKRTISMKLECLSCASGLFLYLRSSSGDYNVITCRCVRIRIVFIILLSIVERPEPAIST